MLLDKESRYELLAAVALFDQGREEAAAGIFNALGLSARLLYNEAAVRVQQGRLDEALRALDEAVRRDGHFVAALMLRGVVLLECDDTAGALDEFARALRLFARPAERPFVDYACAGAPIRIHRAEIAHNAALAAYGAGDYGRGDELAAVAGEARAASLDSGVDDERPSLDDCGVLARTGNPRGMQPVLPGAPGNGRLQIFGLVGEKREERGGVQVCTSPYRVVRECCN